MADGQVTIEALLDDKKLQSGLQGLGSSVNHGLMSTLGGGALKAVGLMASGLLGLGTAATKVGMEWEQSFAQVTKVLQSDDPAAIKKLEKDLLHLSTVIPVTTNTIAELSASLAHMGIGAEDMANVTSVVLKLSSALDLNAAETGKTMAQMLNIFNDPAWAASGETQLNYITRVGDALAWLDANNATTGDQILKLTQRFAAAASAANITEAGAMAISATLAGMGNAAERSGTSMQQVFRAMTAASKAGPKGNKQLKAFAAVMNMTQKEAKAFITEHPEEAFVKFSKGLKDMGTYSDKAKGYMKDIGINGSRAKGVFEDLGMASEQLEKNLAGVSLQGKKGADALEAIGQLERSFGIEKNTMANQLLLLQNRLRIFGVDVYENMLQPMIANALHFGNEMVDKLWQGWNEGAAKGDPASGLISALGDVIGDVVAKIVDIAPGLIDSTMKLMNSLVMSIQKNAPALANGGVKIGLALLKGLIGILPNLGQTAVTLFRALTTALVQNAPEIVKTGVTLMSQLLLGLITGIGELAKAAPVLLRALVDGLKAVDWGKLASDIGIALWDTMRAIFEAGGEILSIIGDLIAGINWSAVWSALSKAADTAWQFISDKATEVWEAIKNIKWSEVWDAITGALGSIAQWLNNHLFGENGEETLKTTSHSLGENIWIWVLDGIGSLGQWLSDQISLAMTNFNVGKTIMDALHAANNLINDVIYTVTRILGGARLDLADIKDFVDNFTLPGTLKFEEFATASANMDAATTSLQALKQEVSTIAADIVLKGTINVPFTEVDKKNLVDKAQEYVTAGEVYLATEQRSIQMFVDLAALPGGDNEAASQITTFLNTVYDATKAEASAKGSEIMALVQKAMTTSEFTAEDALQLEKLMAQYYHILDKANARAKLQSEIGKGFNFAGRFTMNPAEIAQAIREYNENWGKIQSGVVASGQMALVKLTSLMDIAGIPVEQATRWKKALAAAIERQYHELQFEQFQELIISLGVHVNPVGVTESLSLGIQMSLDAALEGLANAGGGKVDIYNLTDAQENWGIKNFGDELWADIKESVIESNGKKTLEDVIRERTLNAVVSGLLYAGTTIPLDNNSNIMLNLLGLNDDSLTKQYRQISDAARILLDPLRPNEAAFRALAKEYEDAGKPIPKALETALKNFDALNIISDYDAFTRRLAEIFEQDVQGVLDGTVTLDEAMANYRKHVKEELGIDYTQYASTDLGTLLVENYINSLDGLSDKIKEKLLEEITKAFADKNLDPMRAQGALFSDSFLNALGQGQVTPKQAAETLAKACIDFPNSVFELAYDKGNLIVTKVADGITENTGSVDTAVDNLFPQSAKDEAKTGAEEIVKNTGEGFQNPETKNEASEKAQQAGQEIVVAHTQSYLEDNGSGAKTLMAAEGGAFEENKEAIMLIASQCATEILTAINNVLSEEAGKGIGETLINGIKLGLENAKEAAVTAARAIANAVKVAISSTMTHTAGYVLGKSVGEGVASGIRDSQKSAVAAAEALAKAVLNALKGVKGFNTHSPSKEGQWIGEMVGLGIEDGLNSSVTGAMRAAETFSSLVMTSLEIDAAEAIAKAQAALDRETLTIRASFADEGYIPTTGGGQSLFTGDIIIENQGGINTDLDFETAMQNAFSEYDRQARYRGGNVRGTGR